MSVTAYPEWASTEELETVMVRHDLAHRAEEIARDAIEMVSWYGDRGVLVNPRTAPMWLDRIDTEWSDEWLLREVDDPDPQEAVMYVHFALELASTQTPESAHRSQSEGGA